MASTGFIFHDQGEEYVLQILFSKEQTLPANYYVGLCNDTLTESDTLATMQNEPTETGYARFEIDLNDTDCVVAQDGDYYRVTFPACLFTAGEDWAAVDTWFLCNVASGTAGKLLASGPLSAPVELGNGSTLTVTPYLRVK